MTGEFMIGVLNTSVVTGLSIVAAGIILRASWKSYSAKCRKKIWIFLAFCLLIPFHLFHFSGAYTAEIPDVVLQEFESRTAGGAGEQEITDSEVPSTQNQTEQIQAAAELPSQMSGQGNSGAELTIADVLFAVWLCMCILLAFYYVAGYRKMKSKIRRCSSACEDGHVQQIIQEIAAECGLKKIPEVRIMKDSEEGPFTTGILKNIIILPDRALHEKDLRFILKHEMIHCRNQDISWRLLFLAVNIIHWFNPFVWYLRRAMEQDMEIACDEEVVTRASREERSEYSDVIMSWIERSRYRGSAVSTGYVKGVGFLKRRFDSILNGGKKKNGLMLAGGVFIFALFLGCMIRLQGGGKVYAEKKITIDYGYEVRTDVDGDGETDRVFVTDNNLDGWDSVETSVSVNLSNGEGTWISYPERWQSYLVTGDLTGKGAADIVLVKLAWMSNHGTGNVKVLHVEKDAAGKPELVEYPGNFIQNTDLEPEWIGGWEDYPYPEDISIFAEGPIALDDDCYGAAIIEKDGKTMLRVVRMADAQTDSGMCIDCSYTPEGWYIEDIQMIYDYYGGDWGEKLLGAWNLEPDVI